MAPVMAGMTQGIVPAGIMPDVQMFSLAMVMLGGRGSASLACAVLPLHACKVVQLILSLPFRAPLLLGLH